MQLLSDLHLYRSCSSDLICKLQVGQIYYPSSPTNREANQGSLISVQKMPCDLINQLLVCLQARLICTEISKFQTSFLIKSFKKKASQSSLLSSTGNSHWLECIIITLGRELSRGQSPKTRWLLGSLNFVGTIQYIHATGFQKVIQWHQQVAELQYLIDQCSKQNYPPFFPLHLYWLNGSEKEDSLYQAALTK